MKPTRTLLAFATGLTALGAAALTSSGALSAQGEGSGKRAAAGGEPVLLELFTSQGCSSCPPADRLATSLAERPDLVVIARPVTYWDRLGWKDTLAKEGNTRLQHAYARKGLAGANGVYTPQLVVNGTYGTVGSRKADIIAGIRQHGATGEAAIRVRDLGAKGYGIGLGGTGRGTAELVLVAVTRKVDVGIMRGENGGTKVTYTNVLRAERKLADWNGGEASHVIAPDTLNVKGADRYALVLRAPGGGKVLAARWLA
jgi:hypothetical protein